MAGSCRRESKVDSSRGKGYCPESRPSSLATAGLRGIATARWNMHGRSRGFGTVESVVAGPALSGRVPRSQWRARTVSSARSRQFC